MTDAKITSKNAPEKASLKQMADAIRVLSMDAVEARHSVDFRAYFAAELEALREMEEGGLLRIEERRIVVLPPGRMLVRAISMAFDKFLRADREKKRYSKVI